MCLFECDLRLVVPEDLKVRDPADLKNLRVPVCGLAPGAVYDPGILAAEDPGRPTPPRSRGREGAPGRWGRCQCGDRCGPRQVLRGLPAAGRQRARPTAWRGGRRVARGEVRARGRSVCPCQPGLLVSVAAHSAATALRAQRAQFFPLPPPSLGTGGSRIAPAVRDRAVLRRSFSMDDVERMGGPRGRPAGCRASGPPGRGSGWRCGGWDWRQGRLTWPSSAFRGAAGGTRSRRSSGGVQRRISGFSTGRRRPRRSARPTRSHGPTTVPLLSAAEPR